jgi:hypothetical protein
MPERLLADSRDRDQKRHPWLVILCESCGGVTDRNLRVKGRALREKRRLIMRVIGLAVLVGALITSPASAAWVVRNGKKLSPFPPLTGTIATLAAKKPYHGVTGMLHVECFTHPELTSLNFGIVLSKNPPNGFMAWSYQVDDMATVTTKPYSRALPANFISLGDGDDPLLKAILAGKRLRLTLLPADGSRLPYEFDLTGAAQAIKQILCRRVRR